MIRIDCRTFILSYMQRHASQSHKPAIPLIGETRVYFRFRFFSFLTEIFFQTVLTGDAGDTSERRQHLHAVHRNHPQRLFFVKYTYTHAACPPDALYLFTYNIASLRIFVNPLNAVETPIKMRRFW